MNMQLTAPWLDIWFAWDSNWYLTLVESGYQSEVGRIPGDSFGQANWAFFPLYPLLGHALSTMTGLGGPISLILVANLCFLAALYLVYRETQDLYGRVTARTATILLLVWPGTHFFSSAYTEALFLLLVVATFRLARKEHILAAALVAALATLTRSPGIILTLPIAFYAWAHWLDENEKAHSVTSGLAFAFSRRGAIVFAYCCIPLVALFSFMAHLNSVSGDPLAFLAVQEAWGRSISNPLMEFARPILAPSTIPLGHWPDFLTMAMVPLVLVVIARQHNWPHLSFALPLYVVAVTAGVVSLNRQMLVVVPLIMLAASMLEQNRLAARLVFFTATIGAMTLMALWSAGYGIV